MLDRPRSVLAHPSLVVAALAVATVGSHLPGLLHGDRPVNPDEAFVVTEGRVVAAGGKLYVGVVDRKPPLVPLFASALDRVRWLPCADRATGLERRWARCRRAPGIRDRPRSQGSEVRRRRDGALRRDHRRIRTHGRPGRQFRILHRATHGSRGLSCRTTPMAAGRSRGGAQRPRPPGRRDRCAAGRRRRVALGSMATPGPRRGPEARSCWSLPSPHSERRCCSGRLEHRVATSTLLAPGH